MILDTHAVSALLAGESGVESKLEGLERHHHPLFVIDEYFFGLALSSKRRQLQPIFPHLLEEQGFAQALVEALK